MSVVLSDWKRMLKETVSVLDVKLAFAGVVFWTIAFVAWFATFVASRTSWGATADAISVNIPPGY